MKLLSGPRKYLSPYVKYSNDLLSNSIGRRDLYHSMFLIWCDAWGNWRSVNLGEPSESFKTKAATIEYFDKKLISLGYVLIDDEEKWESLKVLI